MSIYNLKKSVERLQDTLAKMQQEDFSLEKRDLKKSFFNFKERKLSYLQNSIESNIKSIRESMTDLNEALKFDKNNEKNVIRAQEIIKDINILYEKRNFIKLKDSLDLLHNVISLINVPQKDLMFKKPKNLPDEIRDEIYADINEIEKCFKFGCYRSATIVCGRILETTLHRKYYELTQNDLMEKAPGIGLGKIIAKLEELNIKLGPGITQQIHLINQTRIFSVHNKKITFYPTQTQTQAIILFTLDVVERIFK